MTYTREKPTKTGWYWWRDTALALKLQVVEVVRATDGELCVVWSVGVSEYLKEVGGEFAGPIPMPVETPPKS